TMGNLETEGKPLPHPAYVSAFLMDKLPVTWKLFKRFAAATGRPLPPPPFWGIHDDYPVAYVRWDEARASCEETGARLPSERVGGRKSGEPTPASSRGGTRSRLPNAGSSGASGATPATTRSASARRAPVLMVSSTPEGTCGSGAKTGTRPTPTSRVHATIQWGP